MSIQLIQTGSFNKTESTGSIKFDKAFSTVPIVLVTPHYPDAVKYVEAVQSVTVDGFTLDSGNAESNYYVNWIAVGQS